MTSPSPADPAAHASLLGLAQHLLQKFAAAHSGRHVRSQTRATATALQQMEARLLDDIGVSSQVQATEHHSLSRLNPLVVAVNLYTIPRNGR